MEGNNKISQKGIMAPILLPFCAVFIPFIVLCFFAHPAADDYTYNAVSPFWSTQLELFKHWNGRYSANFLVMSNPILWGSVAIYRLAALFLLFLMPLSIFFVLTSILENAFARKQKIVFTCIIAALVLCLVPSLPEGVYWYPGAVTYIFGCIVAMFYIGMAIRYFNRDIFINTSIHFTICIVLLFLSIGFNEVQMLLLLYGHLFVWLQVKGNKEFRIFLSLLLLCIMFSCLIFFAPGNYYRETHFSNSHLLLHSLGMTILQMGRFFLSWVFYIPLLLASILFAPISLKLGKRSPLSGSLGNYNPRTIFGFLLAILFLCIFPAYWNMGILGQHRTVNTACFFFIPSWFLFVHSMYKRYGLSGRIAQLLNRLPKSSLPLLLAASLLLSGNCGTALREFTNGKIVGFDKEVNTRTALLSNAKRQGLKEITLPLLQNKPVSLFVVDIQPGCDDWVNEVYARYFGLEKICADSLPNTPQH